MYPMPAQAPVAKIADSPVVHAAAEIVTQAIHAAVQDARLAAERCGCHTCRVRASETILWSLAMLHSRPAVTAPASTEPVAQAA